LGTIIANGDLSAILTFIAEYLGIKDFWDLIRIVIDLSLVAYLIYRCMLLFRDSRAQQLLKGVVLILVISMVAGYAGLTTLSFFVDLIIGVLPVLIVIIFQPEIRRAIEGIGKSNFKAFLSSTGLDNVANINLMIEEVVRASTAMSHNRVGALMVFEQSVSLGEIVRTGTIVDAVVSSQLLQLIFVPKTPLHDGAVIIRNDQIHAAACVLPLTDNRNISKELGTRHRAGIGVTENTDAISVIVSEETGKISVARNGVLTRNVTGDTLRMLLKGSLIKELDKNTKRNKFLFWKGNNK